MAAKKPATKKSSKPAKKKVVKVVAKKSVKKAVVKSKPKTTAKPVGKKAAVKSKPAKPVAKVVKLPIVKTKPAPAKEESTRTHYGFNELQEFKALIEKKLTTGHEELKYLNDQIKVTVSLEREALTRMAGRQAQYIDNLDKALERIYNKTYGICRATGKLIDKERLRSVPHATLSMEAKMKNK